MCLITNRIEKVGQEKEEKTNILGNIFFFFFFLLGPRSTIQLLIRVHNSCNKAPRHGENKK